MSDNDYTPLQLYEELHVGEHQIRKERQLHERLEELKVKLSPLEEVSFTRQTFFTMISEFLICNFQKRKVLDLKASKRSNTLTWVGLGREFDV